MRVIGIDPGIAITGYSVIEECGSGPRLINSGCIFTSQELSAASRLAAIHDRILELISAHTPQAMVVEKIFFSKNVRTAFQVGEARGVIILAAAKSNLELYEYTPLQVKQAVAGYGNAEKAQIQKVVQILLGLAKPPAVDDEADAMAVALCYLQNRRWLEAVKGGGRV
ncbi:MAG TPA: crossover junction endodeoxyribonuclease RuvC [Candidatus Limnocylindrales bacterium]|nr:crossover junction endodeoxyribonuclease RuvC [Candidatus Limnocylindrales bacterium]